MKLVARRLFLVPFVTMGIVAACDDTATRFHAASDAAAPDGDTPDSPAAPVTDGGPSCNLPGIFGSPQCMRCMATKCCDKITKCENDPSCAPLQVCALNCLPETDSSGCYKNECVAKWPDAAPLFGEVGECQFGTRNPEAGCVAECSPPPPQ